MKRGPWRVHVRWVGKPYREMKKNWRKVMREPEFGYRDVTCSRVMALEQQPPKMSESVGNHMVVVGKKRNDASRIRTCALEEEQMNTIYVYNDSNLSP